MNTDRVMSVTDAATLLQVTPARVLQLVKAGRIADAGTIGAAHLVQRASVERLAAARAINPPRAGRPRKGPSET